ncbi:N1R/p28-like protein [Turkeypox virus]|uniref:N1R/p28-like protein n=1 Tax=Turkeypox virus TaxID=336486 RepID=A0A0M3ZJN9_9POXV|nr:N1R/p28-like protein [Turkeypox virus]ALA62491.1 N1R/p28-like protein [Turkeypox virus]
MDNLSVLYIDDNFVRLVYDVTDITIIVKNYYVNISRLSFDKEFFKKCLEFDYTKNILLTLEKANNDLGPKYQEEQYGACESSLIICINSNNNLINGYYVHKDLIPYLPWITPIVSIQISQIIDTYISKKLECTIQANESLNKKLINLLTSRGEAYKKELDNMRLRHMENISILKSALDSIKGINTKVNKYMCDMENMIKNNNCETTKIIILQNRDSNNVFKMFVGEHSTVIRRIHKFKNIFRPFFKSIDARVIAGVNTLLERLERNNHISLQRTEFRLLDVTDYSASDLSRDLYRIKDDNDTDINYINTAI